MQTEIKNMYYIEDLEDNEEYLRKQETIKEMLHSILNQPETIETWKTDYKIEIKPELVKILKIDVEAENDLESEDNPESENYTVIDKRSYSLLNWMSESQNKFVVSVGQNLASNLRGLCQFNMTWGKFNNIKEFKYLKRYCPNYLIVWTDHPPEMCNPAGKP